MATAARAASVSASCSLFGGEAPQVTLLDELETADHLVFEDQGHQQAALLVPELHAAAVGLGQVGVIDVVGERAALDEHAPEGRLIVETLLGAHPLGVGRVWLPRPQGLVDRDVLVGAILVDIAFPEVEDFRRALRDTGQDLVEHKTRGDRRDDLCGYRKPFCGRHLHPKGR